MSDAHANQAMSLADCATVSPHNDAAVFVHNAAAVVHDAAVAAHDDASALHDAVTGGAAAATLGTIFFLFM